MEYRKLVNDFLSDNLGKAKKTAQGLKFNCPHCDSGNKFNLEVNLNEKSSNSFQFNCWSCKYHGFISKLLKEYSIDDSWRQIEQFNSTRKNLSEFPLQEKIGKKVVLPLSIPFYENKKVLEYLTTERRIEFEKLKARNVRVSILGDKIYFPFYNNNDGSLFSYCEQDFKTKKYKNFNSLNFVFYEEFINSNFPIIITEGIYDCLSVPNAIPILGTNISKKIKEFCNGKNVILCLDNEVLLEERIRLLNEIKSFGARDAIIFNTQKYKDLNEIYLKNKQLLKRELKKSFKYFLENEN